MKRGIDIFMTASTGSLVVATIVFIIPTVFVVGLLKLVDAFEYAPDLPVDDIFFMSIHCPQVDVVQSSPMARLQHALEHTTVSVACGGARAVASVRLCLCAHLLLKPVGQREQAFACGHAKRVPRQQLAFPLGPVGKGERALIRSGQQVGLKPALELYPAEPVHAAYALRESFLRTESPEGVGVAVNVVCAVCVCGGFMVQWGGVDHVEEERK